MEGHVGCTAQTQERVAQASPPVQLTQLGPSRHRHRRMPNARGLFCPGESCCMRSSRCCILYPVLSGTVSAPSHSPGSTGPRPSTRACHREQASCSHCTGGWQQAEVRSSHSERLRAACAKGTFSGGCRCRGQPAQPRCGQEQLAACEPPPAAVLTCSALPVVSGAARAAAA